MVKIQGHRLTVDILEELKEFDWSREQVRGEKFLACSPFRSERRPSFAVHLETGVWIDSGSSSDTWRKGSLVKLLSFLRNETYEETEEYLLTKYGNILIDTDTLELKPSLSLEEEKPKILTAAELKPYRFRHPYLERERGIPEAVQRQFKVGYSKKDRAVTIPWTDRGGSVVNVKFRSVDSKVFWYLSGGQPVKNHVFGLHFVCRLDKRTVYLVESEIDCMYLWSVGYPAIALGGANLSEQQKRLILQSPIETLVIATDNDKAGKNIRSCIIELMFGIITLQEIRLPEDVKDVNELSPDRLRSVVADVRDVGLSVKLA